MWHVFYTYNFYEESTGWQLEPKVLLLIWIMVLGCSPLQATAEWHCGNLLAWSPGCLLLPSPGLPLEALRRVSDKLTCELGALIRTAALCTSCPTKVQMQRQTSVPPQHGCGPAAGMAVRRLAASSPWQAMRGRDVLALPLHLFARLFQLLLFCSNLDTWLRAGKMPRLHFDPVVHCYCIREWIFICSAVYEEVCAFPFGLWI